MIVPEITPGITVITPTGDRRIALQRCLFYLERQTVKPDQWLVVDDGGTKSACDLKTDLSIEVVERKFTANKAKSFTGNLLAIVERVKHEHIIVMEDDDW